jgi:NADPH:quinone reductase-like Zn-dependent oxidoreductase
MLPASQQQKRDGRWETVWEPAGMELTMGHAVRVDEDYSRCAKIMPSMALLRMEAVRIFSSSICFLHIKLTRDNLDAEYVLVNAEAISPISKALDPAETAPLLCAGTTVFNSIRRLNIIAGETVVIQGLGGLGHLAIQYSKALGFNTVVLSRGKSKKEFALSLGADHYLDTSQKDGVAKLQAMGGAALIVCTAPNSDAISPLTAGLQPKGQLLILARK